MKPDNFWKNIQKQSFMKIHPFGTRVVTYGRTDRHHEANSRFAQIFFSNAPKNEDLSAE